MNTIPTFSTETTAAESVGSSAGTGHAEPRKLRGLERVCKMMGSMKCGDVLMVWDYAADRAVPETEMKPGSERWQQSERLRWQQAARPPGDVR